MESISPKLYLIIHNVRSIYNVGSLFRTADAAGVSKIFLTGYTPTPMDRFGRKRNDFHKTALGAEDTVPWEQYESLTKVVEKLHQEDVSVYAIEQDERSQSYHLSSNEDVAFVVGNEVEGMSVEDLELCDGILEIPQFGDKKSLNVSVAGGIVLYDWVRKNRLEK